MNFIIYFSLPVMGGFVLVNELYRGALWVRALHDELDKNLRLQ